MVFQPVQHAGLQRVQAGAILAVGVGVLGVGSVDLLLGGGDVLGIGHGLEDQVLLCQMLKVGVRSGQHGVGVGVALGLGKGVEVHAV